MKSWTSLVLAAGLSIPVGAAPSLQPAADIAAVPNRGAGTSFANPAISPIIAECAEVDRQLVLLNPVITQGEPAMLRLALRPRIGEKSPKFNAQLVFGGGLRVVVQPPGRIPPYSYRANARGTAVPAISMELLGVPVTRCDLIMASDTETVSGAAFEVPGNYRLRFSLECVEENQPTEQQELGDFTLLVKPAQGEDATALKLMESEYNAFVPLQDRVARMASGREIATPAQIAIYEKIHRELPKAALRPHCMLLLADWYAGTKGLDAGIAVLDAVEKEYANTPMAQEAVIMKHRMLLAEDATRARANYLRMWADPTMTSLLLPRSEFFQSIMAPYVYEIGTQWMLFQEPGPDPTGTGTDPGIRIALSEEVQAMTGLPEFVTPDQLSKNPILFGGDQTPNSLAPGE